MTFVQLVGGVLFANILTIWFVACVVQIIKRDDKAPGWALTGATFCALFAGIIVYLNMST